MEQYVGHPSFSPDTDVLIDLEKDLKVESGFVEALLEVGRLLEVAQKGGKYFVAGVTPSPKHEEIMRTISEKIDAPFELETFDELGSALQWLNLKRGARGRRGRR